jgi:hypothetical protein
MLAEIEQAAADQAAEDAKGQLELFGGLLTSLADQKGEPPRVEEPSHEVMTREGKPFRGSWDEIVRMMRDSNTAFRRSLHAGVHGHGSPTRLFTHRRHHPDAGRGELHPRQCRRGTPAHRQVSRPIKQAVHRDNVATAGRPRLARPGEAGHRPSRPLS